MNTIKDSLLLKDHYPDTDISVFYMDIRAFGKGFEDLFMRSKAEGVRYIRGLPGEVMDDPDSGNLRVLRGEHDHRPAGDRTNSTCWCSRWAPFHARRPSWCGSC